MAFSDIELASNFFNGDTKAFEEIFDRFHSQLYTFAYNLIQDTEEARDITIMSLNQLWYKHKDFDNLPNIKAFLYVSVRNKCLDFLRSKIRQTKRNKELSIFLSHNSTNNPSIEGELLSRLNRSIDELPDRCREVITLLFYKEMKYEQVAQELKISTETVKSQRKYAIDKLKKCLHGSKEMAIVILVLYIAINDCFSMC